MRHILRNMNSSALDNSKESWILGSAAEVFLRYGYHGTTLSQIAKEAGISKTGVHYYFRSKDFLYKKVLEIVIDLLVRTSFEVSSGSKGFGRFRWFLISEQYNNKSHFEKALMEIFPADYGKRLEMINLWLNSPSNMQDYL